MSVHRLRMLLASGALIAAFGPLAAHATPTPAADPSTSDAINNWRAHALALVPAVYQDVVAGSYTDEVVTNDPKWFNKAMVARAAAESSAFAQLDTQSIALIEAYFQSQQPEGGND